MARGQTLRHLVVATRHCSERIARRAFELAMKRRKQVTDEMGKPLPEAAGEMEKSAVTALYYADNASRLLGDEAVAIDGVDAWVSYEPIGLVLAVMPWNFPVWQVMRFAIPAITSGNGIVLKHSPNVTGTESDLMRRYGMTKTQLGSILQRIGQEGWIERLPGHGWQFLPILTSSETYDQGYRFRILIESAALMEPDFKVDEIALRKCLAEQQALIDGAVEWASPAQLFDANRRLHETIAGFSGNVFIIDSLKRINRLRRLMEYRKAVDRVAAARRCREHKTLIELLLAGEKEAATDFIRLHLRDAAREKSSASGA